MSIAVLGYGLFGRAFGGLLEEAGLDFVAFDPVAHVPDHRAAPSAAAAVQGRRWVILAMPVPMMAEALMDLRPHLTAEHRVMDVGSVKVKPCALLDEVLGDAIPHVGTHPLFGPISLARAEQPLRVVVCPSPLHPQAAQDAGGLFRQLGCDVLEQDPRTHDWNMAQTHALAFFVAKGLMDVGVGDKVGIAPPSFQGLRFVLEAVRGDAGHLFSAIQRENPFAAEARARFLEALEAIQRKLACDSDVDESIPMAPPDLREHSPELGEVRDSIDQVDRCLVVLLAQRAKLARRAARVKAAMGAPVLDPVREKVLLRARRGLAEAEGLDPEMTEEVFRAILRLSRSLQTAVT